MRLGLHRANGLQADSAGGRIEVTLGPARVRKDTLLQGSPGCPQVFQTEPDIIRVVEAHMKFKGLLFFLVFPAIAADLPGSQDPPAYEKSQKVEGLLSRYTYIAPEGRTPAEVFRNYQLEFQRMNLVTLYEKGGNSPGWFGPTLGRAEREDDLK